MQTRLDIRLAGSMKKILTEAASSSVIAISGDDPLLVGEATDALREHFKSQGITEREVEIPDRSFDWKQWLGAAGTGSLFSEKRLMDLRLPTGKPGLEGSKALQAWCANPPKDVVLLITLPRADRTMQGSNWFEAIDNAGLVILVPELFRSDLPNWVSQRLRLHGVTATPDAIAWICDQCEGNLIAAHQEILKLVLHADSRGKTLDLDDVRHTVADTARFNPFALGEALLGADTARYLRVLRGLKAEGEPLPLVLWSLAEDLRMVARTQALMDAGRSPEAAIREARIPRHRERLIATTIRRTKPAATWRALRQAAEVDTIAKGLKSDDPWIALERLALNYG